MPNTSLDQYEAAKQGTAFLLLPERAVWRLSGGDRLRYLNGQVTQDVKTMQPGQSRYAAVISAKGRLQGDVWISATPDSLLIDTALELHETLGPRIERYIVADDAVLEDITGQWKLLHRISPDSGLPPQAAFAFPNHRLGLPGTDYWLEQNSVLPEPVVMDPALLEIFRIEAALPKWGHEMSETTLPPEVRLDELATSYSKGCYIGQEVIARLKSIGHVNRLLCLLSAAASSEVPSLLPQSLRFEGKEVGRITSACLSPKFGKPVALGIVARSFASEGNVLESDGPSWKIEKLPS